MSAWLTEKRKPGIDSVMRIAGLYDIDPRLLSGDQLEFAKELALCLVRPGRASGDLRFFSGVITTHQQAATKLARGWGEAGLQGVARLDPQADTARAAVTSNAPHRVLRTVSGPMLLSFPVPVFMRGRSSGRYHSGSRADWV